MAKECGTHTIILVPRGTYPMTMSVRAPSWRDEVRECTVMAWWRACMCHDGFVPHPLHKFRRTSSFYYWWLWHLSEFMSYHLLSTDYVHVQRFHLCLFSLCIYAGFNSFFFNTILTKLSTYLLVEGGPICRVSTCFHLIITSRNVANRAPCRDFGKKPASMWYMLHNAINHSLLST